MAKSVQPAFSLCAAGVHTRPCRAQRRCNVKVKNEENITTSADSVNRNNAAGLLDELITNGNSGPEALYAWFVSEKQLIIQTLIGLSQEDEQHES